MAEGTSNSVVNLGDLAKPADTLIKKISNAVGGIAAPWQIKRVAKAEAEAAIIKAKTDIEITDLQRRAMHRFINEEAQFQQNMEEITAKALPLLTESSNPGAVEDDWITNFFDKCRIVSEADMQNLWSRVLAGEANAPGSFSRRSVNLLSNIDKAEAEVFTAVCDLAWEIEGEIYSIFDFGDNFYKQRNISRSTLMDLESVGLAQYSNGQFRVWGGGRKVTVYYHGRPLTLQVGEHSESSISIGLAILTKTGRELSKICGSKPVVGYWEYSLARWQHNLAKTNAIKSV